MPFRMVFDCYSVRVKLKVMINCNILIAEDELLIAQDISQILHKNGYSVVSIATTAEETIRATREMKPDIVIMDIMLQGGMDGILAAEKILDEHNIPIIFLTSFAEEHLVNRATTLIPFGYLLKPFRDKELIILIELTRQRYKYEQNLHDNINLLTTQLVKSREMEQRLREISVVDDLTGMYNRRGFYTLAGKQLNISQRTGKCLHLCFFDLDNMKEINDVFGHNEGDNAIRAAAGILKKVFRSSDIISRWGGDEFVVLMINAEFDNIQSIEERIKHEMNVFNGSSELKYTLSMSWGIVKHEPANPAGVEELIKLADTIMYRNKMQDKT